MCSRESVCVVGLGEPLDELREPGLNRGDGSLRLCMKQPFKARQRREIGHLRLALRGQEKLVHAPQITDVHQAVGKIHTRRRPQHAVLRRTRYGSFEQVRGGGNVSPRARPAACRMEVRGGALRERPVGIAAQFPLVADRLLEVPPADLIQFRKLASVVLEPRDANRS